MPSPRFSAMRQRLVEEEVANILLRLGLVGAGAMLLHLTLHVLSSAPLSRSLGNVLILIVTGLLGLLLIASAGFHHPPTLFRWLILLACLGNLGVRSIVWVQTAKPPDFVVTDSALYTEMAGELLRHGENPYTWDLTGAVDLYNDIPMAVTPKLNAASEGIYPYPALPFLLAIPFQVLDLPAVLLLSIGIHAAILILLFVVSPQSLQPIVLLPLMLMDFVSITLVGSMDIIWAALLTGMIVTWRKPVLRAVLFGLAASIKQSPWLLTPFLIMYIWHEHEHTRSLWNVGRFLLISGMTFLTLNAPFVAWNAEAWFQGVTEPLQDDLVFYSHGALSSLSQFGFAHLPKSYYLITSLSVLGLLVFAYWRHYDLLKYTFWIMPGIFMWFSYRSLASYWIYWAFPLLATLVTQPDLVGFLSKGDKNITSQPAGQPGNPFEARLSARSGLSGGFTLSLAVVTLVVLFLIGLFLSPSSETIEVRPIFPLSTIDGRITSMRVEVINHGRRAFSPRFAIQNRYSGGNPLPWYIDQGPHSLSPGQSATYHISNARHQPSFLAHDAAQLVVTDAEGTYAFRDVVTIGPDRSFLWPDAIPNPAYHFWNHSQTAPMFWDIITDPPDAGTVSVASKEERGALMFTLAPTESEPSRIVAQNLITFPREPFGIWAYVDPIERSEDPPSVSWGLEIDDGQHQLWFLFGLHGDAKNFSEEDRYIIEQPVTPGKWSYQEMDVLAAYTEAGWSLPDLRPTTYRGLDTDLRLVDLNLFLITDGLRGQDRVRVYFGPIEQADYCIDPRVFLAESFSEPGEHHLRLAESYVQGRNYTKAWEAYRRAFQFCPDMQRIQEMEQLLQIKVGPASK